MTTAAELRALADRVEVADASRDSEGEISVAIGAIPRGRGWKRLTPGFWELRDIHGFCLDIWSAPNYLTSLDAAASIMPDGWWAVRIDMWPGGDINVTVRRCVPRPDIDGGLWHSTGDSEAFSAAPTECRARVAAALRARAHMLEVG